LTIRVGYYENPPKLFNIDQGVPRGFFAEILADIARKENWNLQWVPGTWQEGLARLESGAIDILPDMAYSLKRAEKYEFSDEPVLVNWAVLYTRNDLHIHSLLDLEGKKVAVMRGSIHTDGPEGIKNQVQEFNISCEFIEFDNYQEVFLALQNNVADVGVVNRLFGAASQELFDVRATTVVFNPRHLKFAFPPDGVHTSYLKKTIDNHLRNAFLTPDSKIQQIIRSNLQGLPLEDSEGEGETNIHLTAKEKEWIRSHPKIRVGVDPEFAPFEFFDKNNRYSGFASDYTSILNRRLGINLEIVRRPPWKEVMSMVEKEKIDVLPAVGFTAERSRFLAFTTPYIGFYRMIFCRTEAPFISGPEDLHDLTIAVQVDSSHAGWLKERTDFTPVYFDTLEEVIKAVSNGDADVFIGNLAASTYWIRKLSITNLRAAAPVSMERQLLHMAVRKDWPILVDLLNKGLASISPREAEEIRTRWTASGYNIGLSSRVVRQRIGLIVAGAMCIVALFWFWNRRLKKEIDLRQKAERGLLDSQKQLEDRVHDRTRELAEANVSLQREIREKDRLRTKLHRSEKMEALGLMAGGVAHDLNNILTGIVGYPDLLLVDLPENSPLRRPLEVIKDSGNRAAAVVSDLLTVARGAMREKLPTNLNTLIDEYLQSPEYRELKSRFPSITCTTVAAPDLKNILCSPVQIKKCFMNIITNGFEAIGTEGTVSLETKNVTIEETENSVSPGPGEWITLCVSDTGPGISTEDLEHIFEPFYSKKVMGRSGTGLGLAIVWNTVHDHGGGIRVESSSRRTSFTLFFPVTDVSESARPTELPYSMLKGNGERILVVDDEPQQREIATGMLVSMDYTVDSVGSGEEAVRFLENNRVELLILDMIMKPGMSGLETYKKILQIRPGQKAIIVSGFSEDEEVMEAIQLGAAGFIHKPYTYAQLGTAVRKELKSSGAASPSQPTP
ncbi:MAG: transporter substrate-binding domain-containing protein, partial [Desulfobulbaceae bacterium]|nr:transporter substrate-binding domain-containing protein [Desulfobulbaceae bacterium]